MTQFCFVLNIDKPSEEVRRTPYVEVPRILEEVSKNISEGIRDSGIVRDSEGTVVGSYLLTVEEGTR